MSIKLDPETGRIEDSRCLRSQGGSIVTSLPPAVLDAAGVGDGDAVTISIAPGSNTIEIEASEE